MKAMKTEEPRREMKRFWNVLIEIAAGDRRHDSRCGAGDVRPCDFTRADGRGAQSADDELAVNGPGETF